MYNHYDQSGVPESERVVDPVQYMKDLASRYLPLEKYGFTESVDFISYAPVVIYNSECCRIKIIWRRWELYSGNSIEFQFGRLHAPDDKSKMIWQGEECHCWHTEMGSSYILDYLDKLTPIETVNKKGFPEIIEKIRNTSWFADYAGKRKGPELAAKIEAEVWACYGEKLFDLFDLRKPWLWDDYKKFIFEVYDIKGRIPLINPSFDKVC